MTAQQQQIPLKIVGGTDFARYKKQSIEQSLNMIKSGEALVPYAGYKAVSILSMAATATGRGIYKSSRGNFILSVVGGVVTLTDANFNNLIVGTLVTTDGTVYMTENNNLEVLISDLLKLYVYSYSTGLFSVSNSTPGFTIDFTPGAVDFQNGQFTCPARGTATWRLSDFNDAFTWPNTAGFVGGFATKPDEPQLAMRFPGNGNMLFLFGKTVTEQWVKVGGPDFPYQLSSNFNVDFGVANAATVASIDNFVVWLSVNEKSGPVIRYSTGGEAKKISNDGLDFQFSRLKNPSDSYGFLFQQDGHVIYQITFLSDNLSYIYDFNTNLFSTVSDESEGNHIARNVVFFNNKYYFVAFTDGALYEFGTQFTTFEYIGGKIQAIPRARILAPIRLASQNPFILNEISFTLEQGQENTIQNLGPSNNIELLTQDGMTITTEDGDPILIEYTPVETPENYIISDMCVDFSISIDGGYTFVGNRRLPLNQTGVRQNIMKADGGWGRMNDLTIQLRFWGLGRFVVFDGEATIES